jgi:hypothetical protein
MIQDERYDVDVRYKRTVLKDGKVFVEDFDDLLWSSSDS